MLETESGPLQEQPVPLPTEPSLQSCSDISYPEISLSPAALQVTSVSVEDSFLWLEIGPILTKEIGVKYLGPGFLSYTAEPMSRAPHWGKLQLLSSIWPLNRESTYK